MIIEKCLLCRHDTFKHTKTEAGMMYTCCKCQAEFVLEPEEGGDTIVEGNLLNVNKKGEM